MISPVSRLGLQKQIVYNFIQFGDLPYTLPSTHICCPVLSPCGDGYTSDGYSGVMVTLV